LSPGKRGRGGERGKKQGTPCITLPFTSYGSGGRGGEGSVIPVINLLVFFARRRESRGKERRGRVTGKKRRGGKSENILFTVNFLFLLLLTLEGREGRREKRALAPMKEDEFLICLGEKERRGKCKIYLLILFHYPEGGGSFSLTS